MGQLYTDWKKLSFRFSLLLSAAVASALDNRSSILFRKRQAVLLGDEKQSFPVARGGSNVSNVGMIISLPVQVPTCVLIWTRNWSGFDPITLFEAKLLSANLIHTVTVRQGLQEYWG